MKKLLLVLGLFILPSVVTAGVNPIFIKRSSTDTLTQLLSSDSVLMIRGAGDTIFINPAFITVDSITGIAKMIGSGTVITLLNDTVRIGDTTLSAFPVMPFRNSVGSAFFRYNSTVDSLQWSTDGSVYLNLGTGGGTDSGTVASWQFYNNRADDSLRIDQFDIVSTTDGGTGTDSLIFVYRDSVKVFYIAPDTSRDVTVLQGLPGLLILDSLALSGGGGRLYFGNTTTLYLDSSIMSDIMDNLGINATDSFVNVTGDIMTGDLDMGDNAIGNLSGLAGSNTTGNLILHPGSVGGVVYSNWTLGGDFVYSHGGSDIMGFYASSDSGAYFSGNDSARILDFQLARIDTLESELLFRVGTASGVYIDSATFDSIASAKGRFSAGGGGGTVDSAGIVEETTGTDSTLWNVNQPWRIRAGTGLLITHGDSANIDTNNISVIESEIDHGGLGGLTDDDHTQYLKESDTAAYTTKIVALGDAAYQPLEATLTDIADGTIAENLVNTANPWAANEITEADPIWTSDSSDYAFKTLVTDTVNLLRNDQILNFHTIAGQVDGPGDSVELSLGGNVGGVAYVARDSSIATAGPAETDSIYFMFVMPSWASTVDSAVIVVQGSSSADSAEVTEIEMWGPDKSSSSVVADSSYYSDVTARNTATATRYAYSINNTQIAAGDPITILMVTTLGTKAVGTVYIYDVYLKVSD